MKKNHEPLAIFQNHEPLQKRKCRFCIEMQGYGEEGSMQCTRQLSGPAKDCEAFSYFLTYAHCTTCDTTFDLFKYDNLKDAGHGSPCKVRILTLQEHKQAIEKCKTDGCLLVSLNGRLGYIKPQDGGGYYFTDQNGKGIWFNLQQWEINSAKIVRQDQ